MHDCTEWVGLSLAAPRTALPLLDSGSWLALMQQRGVTTLSTWIEYDTTCNNNSEERVL